MMTATTTNTQPGVATSLHHIDDITSTVQQLRDERDLWEARALQYEAAFQSQTARLDELLNILVATQAELENERLAGRHVQWHSDSPQKPEMKPTSELSSPRTSFPPTFPGDGQLDLELESNSFASREFRYAKTLLQGKDYDAALEEVDRILPGPLSNEARVEALLLKSTILRVTGPKWLYDALAQCSEALDLCHRLSDLECLLPQVQYQRGLCLFQLGMYPQAQKAFAAVGNTEPFNAKAVEFRRSCDEQYEFDKSFAVRRRSAFDEHRTFSEGELDLRKGAHRDVSVFTTLCPSPRGLHLTLVHTTDEQASSHQDSSAPHLYQYFEEVAEAVSPISMGNVSECVNAEHQLSTL